MSDKNEEIEKNVSDQTGVEPGGQAGASSRIENYLGFPSGLTGGSLARRAVSQAIKFGAEILDPQEVASIRSDGQYRVAKLGDATEIRCHTMVIAWSNISQA